MCETEVKADGSSSSKIWSYLGGWTKWHTGDTLGCCPSGSHQEDSDLQPHWPTWLPSTQSKHRETPPPLSWASCRVHTCWIWLCVLVIFLTYVRDICSYSNKNTTPFIYSRKSKTKNQQTKFFLKASNTKSRLMHVIFKNNLKMY